MPTRASPHGRSHPESLADGADVVTQEIANALRPGYHPRRGRRRARVPMTRTSSWRRWLAGSVVAFVVVVALSLAGLTVGSVRRGREARRVHAELEAKLPARGEDR